MAKMVSRETLTVGILAILLALIAAGAMRSYLSKEKELPPQVKQTPPEKLNVPLAATDLPADRFVSKYDYTVEKMTRQEFAKRFPKVDPNRRSLTRKAL